MAAIIDPNSVSVMQSGVEETKTEVNEVLEQEAVVVVGERDMGSMPTSSIATPLADFLARDVLIHSVTLGVGNTLFDYFDPWALLLQHATVADKLKHFHRFRADLVMRVNCSGSPFHYTMVRVAYRPHPGIDASNDWAYNLYNSSNGSNYLLARKMCTSQLIGTNMNPCVDTAVEVRAPWRHFLPGLDLNDLTAHTKIGEASLIGFDQLRHANGGTDGVRFTVYAHFENVCLDVTTAVVPAGFSLSGAIEKAGGIVHKATQLGAAAAAAFSMGAKASTMANEGLNMALTAAALVGFSRPLTLDPPTKTNNNISWNLANYDVEDTSQRLSMAVDSEMTVDGLDLGTDGTDELMLAAIYTRPSFILDTTWDTSLVEGTFLLGSFVTPSLTNVITYQKDGVGALDAAVLMTPVAFAASPFQFFRGTMVFTINVVACKLNKGRLRVTFDPSHRYVAGVSPPTNLVTSVVIDLAETMTGEIEVPWASVHDALRVSPLGVENTFSVQAEMAIRSTAVEGYTNGHILVEVLNNLTCPGTPTPVVVQMYAHAKDMAFYSPVIPSGYIDQQAARVTPLGFEFDITGGDAIVSARQLLKRYTCVRTALIAPPNIGGTMTCTRVALPTFMPLPGYSSLFDELDNVDVKINYVDWSWMGWFSQAFTFMRGTVRVKERVMLTNDTSDFKCAAASTIRLPNGNPYGVTRVNYLKLATGAAAEHTAYIARELFPIGDGGQMLKPDISGNTDIGLPYLSNKRALAPRCAFGIDCGDGRSDHEFSTTFVLSASGAYGSHALKQTLMAAGEDFGLYGFIHAPCIIIEGFPILPT